MGNHKLFAIIGFHAFFSTFGEIQNSIMSTIGIPLTTMFNESIQLHYGFVPDQNQ